VYVRVVLLYLYYVERARVTEHLVDGGGTRRVVVKVVYFAVFREFGSALDQYIVVDVVFFFEEGGNIGEKLANDGVG
jgi:hypothetical protein